MQFWHKTLNTYYYKDYPETKGILTGLCSGRIQNDFRLSISRENYYQQRNPNISYTKCHSAYFDMIIGADAKVYTCCHFKYNPKYCYSDLSNTGLVEASHNIQADVTTDCFTNCKMDALNQFIEYAKGHQEKILKLCEEIKIFKERDRIQEEV